MTIVKNASVLSIGMFLVYTFFLAKTNLFHDWLVTGDVFEYIVVPFLAIFVAAYVIMLIFDIFAKIRGLKEEKIEETKEEDEEKKEGYIQYS